MQHKLITLTGGDLCGKGTQSEIIKKLIEDQYGHCTKFSFPRYERPFGKLMGAMLDIQQFELKGVPYPSNVAPCNVSPHEYIGLLRGGNWTGHISKTGKGEVFQFLCAADKYDAQEEIGEALKLGHVVCDRYDPELLVYGAVDFGGKEEPARSIMEGLTYRSDIVIVLWNSRGCFSRAGEVPDVNERDRAFQETTFETFKKYAPQYGWHILDVADLIDPDIVVSVSNVTKEIIGLSSESGLLLDFSRSAVVDTLRAKGILSKEELVER